jgi:phytol kinase
MAAVNLLGGLMLIYILAILRWGEGNLFYEGLAREVDRPRRSLYIVLPFAATALGGIASSALFGSLAVVGFVVGGWGDAVGEPVGIRLGKHRYRVPNFGSGVSSHRSLEGSAAVFIASFTGAVLAMTIAGLQPARARETLFLAAACVAAAATGVEAISHHGLDNLTIQLVASGVAHAFLF